MVVAKEFQSIFLNSSVSGLVTGIAQQSRFAQLVRYTIVLGVFKPKKNFQLLPSLHDAPSMIPRWR